MFDAEAADKELRNLTSVQLGPETKEYHLLRADEEYRNGNESHSIYYQVRALFQCSDLRLVTEAQDLENQQPNTTEILSEASPKEISDYKNNKFLQNILMYQETLEMLSPKPNEQKPVENLDFLADFPDPNAGFERISHICHQFPREWCVLQLCKSFNPATTYSTFCDIAAAKGDIYVSLLLHCRSPELPPTCLHFNSKALADIFKEYATLVERFRRVVTVDPLAVKTQEAKAKYWNELSAFEVYLKKLISDLTSIFAPYCYLFLGKRYNCPAIQQQCKLTFARVDEFCVEHNWNNHHRVLLSQAALHANRLPKDQMKLLSYKLSNSNNYCKTVERLVFELLQSCANEWTQLEQRQPLAMKRFPIILLVDERLDHMHWEQLAPMQECARNKSLHSLWRLFNCHKAHIQHGYYTVKIRSGTTLINPDADLPRSGKRWRSFLEYWLAHWQHLFETVPSETFMLKDAFKADCFVYAGHGSSLQYVSSRLICRNRIKGIVFLFGCDSTRVLSSGLYSALYGAQDYLHGALCPTVVGTLMPALDANLDNVSTNILSHWITPANSKIIPWTHIDRATWISKGTLKVPKDGATLAMVQHSDYQIGSLCEILANIQLGRVEPKIYNCCVYVCRGLPAWNLVAQRMFF